MCQVVHSVRTCLLLEVYDSKAQGPVYYPIYTIPQREDRSVTWGCGTAHLCCWGAEARSLRDSTAWTRCAPPCGRMPGSLSALAAAWGASRTPASLCQSWTVWSPGTCLAIHSGLSPERESGGSCLDSTKLLHLSHMSVIWQGRRNPMSQTDTMKKIKKQVTNKLISKQNSNCCSDILQPLPPPFRYFWRTAFIPLLQAAKHFQNTEGLVCPLCSVRYTEQPKNCSLCFETRVKHISLHYVGLQGSKNYHWAVEQHCIK